MNNKVESLFERWCELEDSEKKELAKRMRSHKNFTSNLHRMVELSEKYGPDAVLEAMKGNNDAAREAAKKFKSNKP